MDTKQGGCSIEGCERPLRLRGYCQTHYTKARRHGLIEKVRNRNTPTLTEKFSKSYRVTANGCWIWSGTVDVHGYGVIVDERHRNAKAHRVSYDLRFGFLPDHLAVCHDCDMPQCVNPDHLYLGTDLENRHDSVSQLRHAFGDRNGKSKLSSTDVAAIRSRYALGGISQTDLACEYGVNASCISVIISRVNWKLSG